jgi:4a-hydroxytetrahydrobiopterin dehydratase
MISGEEFLEHDLSDWRFLNRGIHARFGTGDFLGSMRLAASIAVVAEEMNHHPDLDVRWGRLDVTLFSHDVLGVTDRDLDLARTISELAEAQGCTAKPQEVTVVELALDTPDFAAVQPFWVALLGIPADPRSDDVLYDKTGQVPVLWFQPTDDHHEPRQRFHLDVFVPPELAEERVAAAIAAGGSLVSDAEAPSFWVLSDSQGNRACICTSRDSAAE